MQEPIIVLTATGGIETGKIPRYVAHNIAQVASKGILQAWNDPIIRADYERWKAEQAAKARLDAAQQGERTWHT